MSVFDEVLKYNEAYRASFADRGIPVFPAKRLAVVACMDARLDIHEMLGLTSGDAHVIRNAGGVVTEDVIRSLVISQRLLGTREIALIHHTDCGMLSFSDDEMAARIEKETGSRPAFAFRAFRDLHQDVLDSIALLQASPFLPHKDEIRGFVYDVASGGLTQVPGPGAAAAK